MASYVSHTNRKGQTFYLHQRVTRTGQLRYVFRQQLLPEEAMRTIPPSHEVAEGVNGNVSLRKIKPRPITELELQRVRRVLQKHAHLQLCQAAVKAKTIEVYEPRGVKRYESRAQDNLPGRWSGLTSAKIRAHELRQAQYDPTMRFVLVDRKARHFSVERMCYRSWHDGWLSLEKTGLLKELAEEYLPHLTQESFYHLWPY